MLEYLLISIRITLFPVVRPELIQKVTFLSKMGAN